ncbi:MAG: rRNA pseudouridine synthase [Bacteroidales bacterium]|nr:rRNA pseudouridine synthase [Bacteroidales bacterium]
MKKQENNNRRNDNKPGEFRRSTKPQTIKKEKTPSESDSIRLNRYIANAGVCSRRDADEHIKNGLVTVNGVVVTDMGVKVLRSDEVCFKGKRLMPERKVYILLNKPKNYVTTTDDPQGRDIVTDLIKSACSERVYPVGRLDRDTTGLLLLTNDGELAKKLSHPSFNKKKIYQVGLDKVLKKEDLDKVREGFELEDGFIKVDSIEFISDDKRELGVELHSGRNRIVRRIFEHLGYRIKKLDRVYYVGLTKKDLPRGKWRFLNENEIAMLKMGSFR